MNEGVLIRYLGKWMTFGSSFGLALRGRTRWGSSACGEVLGPFFRFGFGSDFFGFWMDFGRFLGAQNGPKIDFWEVFWQAFFRTRFCIDFSSILGGSKHEKWWFYYGKTMILTKSTFSKKMRKSIDFGRFLGGQNTPESMKNRV